MTKLWQKGYDLNREIELFTVGDDPDLDQRLVKYDCVASMVHAKMLGKMGILKNKEVKQLAAELENIIKLHKNGQFPITSDQEDCHTAIENHLTEKLGDVGKKIHTARSRNDQVLTALRLFYKDQIQECEELIDGLIEPMESFIKRSGEMLLPGYTHMRKAMPSSVAMWGSAFVDSMKDNQKLLDAVLGLIDQSPLGTAAGYGLPLKIDREFTARELGFERVQENPIYAQNSRGKFETSLLHALSQIMLDLNRIASDLILFSMPEFGFFELPDEFCTGSSIMPQKKNPDVLEILRAKYHVVRSCQHEVESIVGNLISGFNRDIQLTKEPTFRGLDTTLESLSVAVLIFDELKVNAERCEDAMTDELFATEEIYRLVEKGIPFREAYRRVAQKYKSSS